MIDIGDVPQVSVVVAILNAAKTVEQCIASISAQDYPNKQLVVIDGASNDGSLEIIKSKADAIQHWESAPDRGIYHAWNKALDAATGEWLCFLGADDYFAGESGLSALVRAGERDKSDLVCSLGTYVDETGKPLFTHGQPWDGRE